MHKLMLSLFGDEERKYTSYEMWKKYNARNGREIISDKPKKFYNLKRKHKGKTYFC